MAKKKATDGVTLAEFRAWLQGVEEMQGADWAPSAEQWRKIKAKFNDIVEEEASAPVLAPQGHTLRQPYQPPPFQQFAPGTMPAPERPSMPQPLPQGLQSGLGGTKTPDIDSTNGYSSSLV
jgi:hypothetical protein